MFKKVYYFLLSFSLTDHMQSLVHSHPSHMISPLSETTTIGGQSISLCSHSEDQTLMESMLQEDITGLYRHDFDDDLVDDSDVQCISPPPGYTDILPQPLLMDEPSLFCGEFDNLDDHDNHHHHLGHQHRHHHHNYHHRHEREECRDDDDNDLHHSSHNHHNLDVECVSPSSSLFSASIFSELASIFDEHLNRTSADERNSQEFTEDPFGDGLKPSTSFTLSDYRQQQHRTSATSDIVAHHQSFDAVNRSGASSISHIMSTSLNSQKSNDFGGRKLTKPYQTTDSSSREAMQSSNYSLSSTTSHNTDTRSGGIGDSGNGCCNNSTSGKPTPPKPPRKSIERSKAKSLDATRNGGKLTLAKSDFNVDYTGGESETDSQSRSIPSQKQQEQLIDSDHYSSPLHQNSVIINNDNGKCIFHKTFLSLYNFL